MNSSKKIKVLIIDDSAVVRKLLSQMLSSDRDIDVVGTAVDAFAARDKIKKLKPDVLTLDVEMPKMDGITFLRNLMRLHPMPVIMVSTLTEKGAGVTLDALSIGAVDFVTKPQLDITNSFDDYAGELIDKIKAAARAKPRQMRSSAAPAKPLDVKHSIEEVMPGSAGSKHFKTTDKLIAIGASTGGTEAIKEVLVNLPLGMPGIVITQHIPASFSRAFAERVNTHAALTVKEATDGEFIVPGHVYIAPGDRHLLVVRDGARWRSKLSDDVPVNRHKPSVDVLFRSVANSAGPNAMGIILTGMGKDGAQGLLDMKEAGAKTIAQDESSSVVWGMPGSAVELGAAEEVLPLGQISGRLVNEYMRRAAKAS